MAGAGELSYGDLITIVDDRVSEKGQREYCYLSTLQNPLQELARLVSLSPTEITRPMTMVCVYEIIPPSSDISLGTGINMGKRFKLRHLGTGDFVTFDPAKRDSPVFLEPDQELGRGLRDPRTLFTFAATLKTISSVAPVHGTDQVKIVMDGDCPLRIEQNELTKEHCAKYVSKETADDSKEDSQQWTFRTQVYQKFDRRVGQWGTDSHVFIGMTTRIFHAENESYLTAAGSVHQAGGKKLCLHKAVEIRGGKLKRNSNRLFSIVNASLSRRHLGGQIEAGDIFRLYNLASAQYLTIRSSYLDVGDEVVSVISIEENGIIVVPSGVTGRICEMLPITVLWDGRSELVMAERHTLVKKSRDTKLELNFCTKDNFVEMAESYFELAPIRKTNDASISIDDFYTIHAIRNPVIEGMRLLENFRCLLFEYQILRPVCLDEGRSTVSMPHLCFVL
jgi:hypothetical protein